MDELIESTRGSLESGEPSDIKKSASERLKVLVEEGVLGLKTCLSIQLANPAIIAENAIIVSTDEELLMQTPLDALLSAIAEAEGRKYVYLEDGIPEIGLEGEHLMSLYDMSELGPFLGGTRGAHFVSMSSAAAEIRDFYGSEKTRATMIIALIIGGSVLLVILITFFILSHLIRTRITQPIDRLSSAAGEVMKGNLDIEVEIHEGSDLEELERAFGAMVESVRKFIARSVEDRTFPRAGCDRSFQSSDRGALYDRRLLYLNMAE